MMAPEDTQDYTVVSVHSDLGSIVVLRCINNKTKERVLVACDHRPAQDIITALGTVSNPITIDAEDWQITGRWSA